MARAAVLMASGLRGLCRVVCIAVVMAAGLPIRPSSSAGLLPRPMPVPVLARGLRLRGGGKGDERKSGVPGAESADEEWTVATVRSWRELSSPTSNSAQADGQPPAGDGGRRRIFEMELNVAAPAGSPAAQDGAQPYEPGDCIAVHAPNHASLVLAMVDLLVPAGAVGRAPGGQLSEMDAEILPSRAASAASAQLSSHAATCTAANIPREAADGLFPATYSQDERRRLESCLPHFELEELVWRRDLTSLSKVCVSRLGPLCADEADVKLVEELTSSGAVFDARVRRPAISIVELLSSLPSCRPPLRTILGLLPPLMPRLYSIASSPLQYAGVSSQLGDSGREDRGTFTVKIAFALVNRTLPRDQQLRGTVDRNGPEEERGNGLLCGVGGMWQKLSAASGLQALAESAGSLYRSTADMKARLRSLVMDIHMASGGTCKNEGLQDGRTAHGLDKGADACSRLGHCTGFLVDMCLASPSSPLPSVPGGAHGANCHVNPQTASVRVQMKRATAFKLPRSPGTPVVLFAFGTGLAPFIGFLWHRRLSSLTSGQSWGDVWVVVSCRHRHELIYADDLLRCFTPTCTGCAKTAESRGEQWSEVGVGRHPAGLAGGRYQTGCGGLAGVFLICSREHHAGALFFSRAALPPAQGSGLSCLESQGREGRWIDLSAQVGKQRTHVGHLLQSHFGTWLLRTMFAGTQSGAQGKTERDSGASQSQLRIYVCGDKLAAKAMQVQLVDGLVSTGCCDSPARARATVKQWIDDGDYLQDVWLDCEPEVSGGQGRHSPERQAGTPGSSDLGGGGAASAHSPASKAMPSTRDEAAHAREGAPEAASRQPPARLPQNEFRRLQRATRRAAATPIISSLAGSRAPAAAPTPPLVIMYSTRTGHSEKLALEFATRVRQHWAAAAARRQHGADCTHEVEELVQVMDISQVTADALGAGLGNSSWSKKKQCVFAFFVSTWEQGEPCFDAAPFFEWLGSDDSHSFAHHLRFTVCGLGSSAPRYASTYQQAAKTLSSLLRAHGALQVCKMGEEDEQHPHLGYEAWASEFCQLLFSGNLPPIPTADIPALELRAESLGESDREERSVAQSERLAGKMPAKGSDKSLRHEGAPMMLRLLWLPARHGGGQAERVCNSLAVYLRPKLMDLGCVVISESAGDREPETLASDAAAVFVFCEGATRASSQSWFVDWLKDAVNDWRVEKTLFRGLGFGVYSIGQGVVEGAPAISEGENACGSLCRASWKEAKEVDFSLFRLGAVRLFSPVNCSALHGDAWLRANPEQPVEMDGHLVPAIAQHLLPAISRALGHDGAAAAGSKEALDRQKQRSIRPGGLGSLAQLPGEGDGEQASVDAGHVDDIENLGQSAGCGGGEERIGGEMVTSTVRASLVKQGYTVVGSHSGVKLCRWTKSQLRGRGGCYKHTFYGIASHRCMEATPSLACANKCVFCWRHHTNPVGTSWTWQQEDAPEILAGCLKGHYAAIQRMKEVPGVKAERLAEAAEVRHCALSLVGEPIMYPQINRLLDLLHSNGISSYLVTNAQFPDAIRTLAPVTQLYVSIDAATPEALKDVDRPLFADFWERLLRSLAELRRKDTRTVYRLTLIKERNVKELPQYAALVARGVPHFIEVKGVTFCGDQKGSNISMASVPYQAEVVAFAHQLVEHIDNVNGGEMAGLYQVACEHAHSCCVLIAHVRYKKGDDWHTHIDYEGFIAAWHRWRESGGGAGATVLNGEGGDADDGAAMDVMSYTAPTPAWALIGAAESGFDPAETRVSGKSKRPRPVLQDRARAR